MRRFSILCAALGLAATALVATSPAQASYKVIRWDNTGYCEIWDNAFSTTPFPADYKAVSHSVPTFMDAVAVKDRLFHAAHCTL